MSDSSSSGAAISWPATLPTPLLGRRHLIFPRSKVTVMESGRKRVRREHENPIELLDVQWNFIQDEYQTFRSFFIDDLGQGVSLFTMVTYEPSPNVGYLLEVTRSLGFFEGAYTFSKSDNLFTVSAVLEIDSESSTEIPDPAYHEVDMMPPATVSYPDSTCRDEIRVDLPTIVGLENVVIEYSLSEDGPWTFWGETRQAQSYVIFSNYFSGYWVRIKAETGSGSSVHRFQPQAPAVSPPSFVVETHHLSMSDFTPTPLSEFALIYEAESPLEEGRMVAGVYSGNLTDPSSGRLAYAVPLFSDAFVEVGPRYSEQIFPNTSADNTQMRITLSSDQPGVTLKLTADGTDPTTSNGEDTTLTMNPFQDPTLRSVVICRAFKDGCKSPPIYILMDIEREATLRIQTTLRRADGAANCWCARWINAEIAPGVCVQTESGSQPGPCPNQIPQSPCQPPSDPTLWESALLNACQAALSNPPTTGMGRVLSEWTVTEAFNFNTSAHYEGPMLTVCPSAPWGGGQWRYATFIGYLEEISYTWQSEYTNGPSEDLYLLSSTAEIASLDDEGNPNPPSATDYPDPAIGELRPQVTALVGASGGTTNNLGDELFELMPGIVKTCSLLLPGELTLVNVTQSCCNS